jgi:integrase/recombinase XerD
MTLQKLAGVAGFEPATGGMFEPSPTTFTSQPQEPYNYNMADIKFKSLLNQIAKLSQEEREQLFSLAQGKTSILKSPGEGIQDWVAEMVARGLAEGTIDMYTRTVKRFLARYPMPTSRDLRNYSVERLQEVSPTKVRNDQKALRSYFSFLEVEGLWLSNPAKSLKLIKIKKIIRQAPDKADVDKLLGAWAGSQQRMKDRLLIALLTDTGLRISEACSIELANVDLDNSQIKVMGKGGKERLVPISPVIVTKLREYIETENLKGKYLFPAGAKPEHISEKYGKELQRGYWGPRSVARTFRRVCKRLGIKPTITPHHLRHYFATYALRNGAKLEIVSKILGHASVGITADVYRTVKQDEIQAEHKKYSPLAGREG